MWPPSSRTNVAAHAAPVINARINRPLRFVIVIVFE